MKTLKPFVSDSKNKVYHSGVDVEGIFAPCLVYGQVVYTGRGEEGYCVVVQHTADECTKYDRLTDVFVQTGQTIDGNVLIGKCDKYFHFEYLTTEKSIWPVRIASRVYYKQDPTFILTDGDALFDMKASLFNSYRYIDTENQILTATMADELSNNKGDDE